MDGLEKWWAFSLPIAEKWWPFSLLPIALVAVWWLWWRLPKREVAKLRLSIRKQKDRVDVEDTFRKSIGQAIGAIAVLGGAAFALVQFFDQRNTAQRQIDVAQQQVKISQQQASHDLLISNQIAKGFEQLGSDKIEVRLGGIYALEGILRMPPPDTTSPDYRQPVLEALCAFVREHKVGIIVVDPPTTEDMDVLREHAIGRIAAGPPATDVQAVLTVIGRRPKELKLVDLSKAVVPGAVLQNANLSGAYLSGADLSRAYLGGADLTSASLSGAHLNHADLSGAHLDDATLASANLTGAYLVRADLSGVFLVTANLSGAILSRANLSRARLHIANLSGAILSNADLSGADLMDVNLNDADLGDANLTGVHLDNQEQLSRACGKPVALPEGFTLDRPCPEYNPK
jgi:Pentapeptide repeats (8 copies)